MTLATYLINNPAARIETDNINKIFAPFSLTIDEVVRCPQSVKYILKLPLDVNHQDKIRKAEKKISYALSSAIDSEYTYGHENNYVYIERPATFNVVPFNDFTNAFKSDKLNLAIGIDRDGKKVITNLSKAPHILVAGTTGSGKSELLHSFVASLISGMAYTQVELLIIDPKRAEFSPYKNCKRIKLETEMSNVPGLLNTAVEIMEKRYIELEKNNAKDIYKYTGTMDMHPIVIIIDELADLIQTYPSIENSLVRIAQKARACGIHLIVGTQSPRKEVVTGRIKANFPTKIALRTTGQVESRIILDRIGAEKLLGKGDMLFLANGSFDTLRIQSPYVSETEKISLAESIKREKAAEPVIKTEPIILPEPIHEEPQRIGFMQKLKNLWNAPQTTTARDYITVIRR